MMSVRAIYNSIARHKWPELPSGSQMLFIERCPRGWTIVRKATQEERGDLLPDDAILCVKD